MPIDEGPIRGPKYGIVVPDPRLLLGSLKANPLADELPSRSGWTALRSGSRELSGCVAALTLHRHRSD